MATRKKEALRTVGSAGVGAVAGAAAFEIVGGVGLAAGGTAIGLTAGPFIAIGAGLGAAAYGLYWMGKQVGKGGRRGK